MTTSKSRRQPGKNNQGAVPRDKNGPGGALGNDAPAVSNARLGLLLLPVSIVIVLIGLVAGLVAVWVVGIVLIAGDLALCGNAVVRASRSRTKDRWAQGQANV